MHAFFANIANTTVGVYFYAATNPDWNTNGSMWLLLDNGPIFMLPKDLGSL